MKIRNSLLILVTCCMAYSCTTKTEDNPFLQSSKPSMVFRLLIR